MTRLVRSFVAALCCAALLPFSAASATVLWQSDFLTKGIEQFVTYDVGPQVNPEFVQHSGPSHWLVRNGALTQTSNIYGTPDPGDPSVNDTNPYTGTHAVVKDLTAQDGIFLFQFKTADNDGIGLVFRFQDQKNFMRFYSMIDPGNGGPITRIEKWTNGVWEILAKVEDPEMVYRQNVMETMLVVANGKKIEAYLGDLNQPILTAEDPDPKPGTFGMSLYASEGFDATKFQALSPDSSLYVANIKNPSGDPLSGYFTSLAKDNKTVAGIYTNPGGQAVFADLAPDTYQLLLGGLTLEPLPPQAANVKAGISSQDFTLDVKPTATVADLSTDAGAQWKIKLPAAATDDLRDPAASESGLDDYTVPSDWSDISADDNIYGWLRVHVSVPTASQGKDLALTGWNLDDADWTYWNGTYLGRDTNYANLRTYVIPGALVKADNVLAIRGFDGGGAGGITTAAPKLVVANPSVTVTGTVKDAAGKPVEGVEVSAFAPDTPWGAQNSTALTNDEGVYRISGLAPGAYTVTRSPRVDLDPANGESMSQTAAGGETITANFTVGVRPQTSLSSGAGIKWLVLYPANPGDLKPAAVSGVDESAWNEVLAPGNLESQGLGDEHSLFWYRAHITLPDSFRAFQGRDLILTGFNVDDADVTYFNGEKIGQTGTLPTDPEDPAGTGYSGDAGGIRTYTIPAALVKWDGDNVLAINGYENTGDSGMTNAAPTLLVAPGPSVAKGDVNGNGRVEITDVLAALQSVAGLKTLTPEQTAAADINGNSKVDITDVVAILRAVAGLSTL